MADWATACMDGVGVLDSSEVCLFYMAVSPQGASSNITARIAFSLPVLCCVQCTAGAAVHMIAAGCVYVVWSSTGDK